MEISHQIKELFVQLSDTEQQILLQELKQSSTKFQFDRKVSHCPHCGCEKIIKHSKFKDTQRYKCKTCSRTFLPSTGTYMHNVKKKNKYAEYARIIKEEGLHPISYMAKQLDISIPTAFSWRHRLLLSTPKKKGTFMGEVQADDLWFLYSQKGRKGLKYSRKRGKGKQQGDNGFQTKVIAASDKDQVEMKVSKIGRISKADIISAIGDKFKRHAKLVTDGHPSFGAFAKGAELEHVKFPAKKHKAETGENVQYINNLASRLVGLVNHKLRGVATKYLQQYVSYFAYTQNDTFDVSKKGFTTNTKVWDAFTNIEKMYEKFIKTKSVRTYRCPISKTWKAQNWNQHVMNSFSYI